MSFYIKWEHLIQNKKIQENRERRKTSFPKETVENADLRKAVLSKEMTIYDCEIFVFQFCSV